MEITFLFNMRQGWSIFKCMWQGVGGGGADCKVCFVCREYSVIALFMRGHGLCEHAGHGVNTGEFIPPAETELYSLGGGRGARVN